MGSVRTGLWTVDENPIAGACNGPVMPRERDKNSGQYTVSYPSSDFLEALDILNGSASSQDVAKEVGCAYRTAHAKLSILEEKGMISSRKVGNARLWQSLDVESRDLNLNNSEGSV